MFICFTFDMPHAAAEHENKGMLLAPKWLKMDRIPRARLAVRKSATVQEPSVRVTDRPNFPK